MAAYYYQHDGKQLGPVSAGQLMELATAGRLRPDDLVWKEGMPKWVPASRLKGLFSEASTAILPAPVLPPLDPVTPPLPAALEAVPVEQAAPLHPGNSRGGQAVLGIFQQFLAEIRRTAQVTWEQTTRLCRYLQGLGQRRTLDRQAHQAQMALGKKMNETGAGDANLRTQLAQLDDRLESVKAAKSSTKPLETERQGLYIRLATPALGQAQSPKGAETEHRDAVAAQDALKNHQEHLIRSRAALIPTASQDCVRVGIGYGAVFLILFLLLLLVVVPRRRIPDGPGPIVENPPVTQPKTSPKGKQPLPKDEPPVTATTAKEAFAQGEKAIEKNDYNLAVRHFNLAIKLDPRMALAWCERGRCNLSLGKLEEAVADCTKAIELDPQLGKAYTWRGGAFMDKNELDKAIADATRAIQLDPNFLFSYYVRGNSWWSKGDGNQAVNDFTQAIRLNDAVPLYYRARSLVYADYNRINLAIQDANRAIQLESGDATNFYCRANAFWCGEQYERALPDLSKAIELNPNYATAYAYRALVQAKLNRTQPALNDAKKAIECDDTLPVAWVSRGVALEKAGQIDQSLADFNKALSLSPQFAMAFLYRGNAYLKGGQPALALRDYDEAIRNAPGWAEALETRGQFHQSRGNQALAQADLNQARKIRSER